MAEPKKLTDDITVNDGGGLFDAFGLIDTLIIDCNDLPRLLFDGKNVLFCARLANMVQKLSVLREGVKTDTEALKKQVAELTEMLNGGDDSCSMLTDTQ